MVIAGLALPGASLLMLIGVFVFMSAWGERQQVVSDFTLNGVVVRQAMQPLGLRLHADQTLAEVAAQIANASQAVYLVIDGGRLAGVVTRRELTGALRKKGPAARLAEYVSRDFLVLDPDRPLIEARERLAGRAIQAAIVSENGVVIGTLSQADLLHAAEILEAHPDTLRAKNRSDPPCPGGCDAW